MEKTHLLCLSIVYLSALASGTKEACCPLNSPCSSINDKCCSIPNGKSYCNLKTRRCEAVRHCDESSPNDCPFNDLSAKEIENVIDIIRKSKAFTPQLEFSIVRKQEPKKKLWNSGDKAAQERVAYVVVYDLGRSLLSELFVSLSNQRIISHTTRTDSVGPMTSSDYSVAEEVLNKDPRIRQAYERRGLNVSNAAFDIWAYGAQKIGNVNGRRRVKVVFNYKEPSTIFMDWSPVEGISATIDIASRKIIHFSDKGSVPVPKPPCISNSNEHITLPESESLPKSAIQINGYQIKWHNWKLQYSMDPVHGLQLYHVRYFSDGEERFLIYKFSLSEMFVPYGADGETWRWRGAFDAGEYGVGKDAAPLTLGVDVPMNAKLLSCPQLNDVTGEVNELEGCIAVYEHDASPVYKHYGGEFSLQKRGTEMIITSMCSVGNYDYMFDLIFSMDGNIDVRTLATGIVLARAVHDEKNDPNCIEDCQDFVNEHTVAPIHQHFLNYRIDFDIDGSNNMMTEVDFVNDPKGPVNPDGGAFSLRRTLIRNETFRDYSAPNARFWSVINAQSRNRFNTPRGYSIHPTSPGYTFLQPGSALDQAMFIKHPIWVTAYRDDEQGAAGVFSRSGKSGQGLPQYVKNGESLENCDIVVWHTFAVTHAPRPEEFPLMNRMPSGFHILSRNFQSANPNVDQCEGNK